MEHHHFLQEIHLQMVDFPLLCYFTGVYLLFKLFISYPLHSWPVSFCRRHGGYGICSWLFQNARCDWEKISTWQIMRSETRFPFNLFIAGWSESWNWTDNLTTHTISNLSGIEYSQSFNITRKNIHWFGHPQKELLKKNIFFKKLKRHGSNFI